MNRFWPFNRRQDRIDELLCAYADGEIGPEELERALGPEVWEERRQEAEGLRWTAQLLRSIEPVEAPRSFALSSAPAPAARPARRYSFAPAVASAAASLVLGVLVAGQFTGALSQGAGPGPEDPLAVVVWMQGGTGDGDPSFGMMITDREAAPADEPVPAASLPAAAPEAAGRLEGHAEPVPDEAGSDDLREPLRSETFGRADGAAGDEPPEAQAEDLEPDGQTASPSSSTPRRLPEDADFPLPDFPSAGYGVTPDYWESVLESPRAAGPQADEAMAMAAQDNGGLLVPLWQLQAGAAAVAVITAGGWLVLRRRETAG